MPQRITVIYICSLCETETDEPGKVTPYQIVGPGKPLNFDICTACAEVGPFRDVLERGLRDRGVKAPAPPAASKGKIVEPVAGELICKAGCGRTFKMPQGRAAHERWCRKSPAEVEVHKAEIRAARAAKK